DRLGDDCRGTANRSQDRCDEGSCHVSLAMRASRRVMVAPRRGSRRRAQRRRRHPSGAYRRNIADTEAGAKCDPSPRRRALRYLVCATIVRAARKRGVIMINRTTWIVLGTGLLMLAGCGGGGSDDPPVPLAAITTANAPAIARSVVTAAFQGDDLGT